MNVLKRLLGGLLATAILVGGLLVAAVVALTGLVLLLFRGARLQPACPRPRTDGPRPMRPAGTGDVIDVVATEVSVDRSKP